MRKVLLVILAVVFCVCLTGCGGSEIPSIYRRVIPEFVPKLGSMIYDEMETFSENNVFGLRTYGDDKYTISDYGNWKVHVIFNYEKVEGLEFENIYEK